MSALSKSTDFAADAARDDAIVALEEQILGWQLKGAPGVQEVVCRELRHDAHQFQAPYNHIQAAIFREIDADRNVSVLTINALLRDCPGIAEIGGAETLRTFAWAAPAVVSEADGQKQAMAVIQSWRRLQSPLSKPGDVELIRADAVSPATIDWIWPGWLAAGKFHLIAGSPGTGKTTLSLGIAATITNGGTFPSGDPASVGSVLMWTGEDDLADSIVPRFMACGGDRSKLHFVGGIKDESGEIVPFDPARDIGGLVSAGRNIKDLRLLIVDPVVSAIAGDCHKNSETRRALQPLVDFAAEAGVAVLGVTHYSKGTAGRDPAERVTGSLAFVAVSRLVMATAKPKEPGELWRLVRAKSNIGPDGGGFEYDLQRVPVGANGDVQGQCVQWGGALDGTAQSLLAEVEVVEPDSSAPNRKAAEEWLEAILGTGEVRSAFIKEMAGQSGHRWATVRRAKDALGITPFRKVPNGEWFWRMPQMLTSSPDAHPKNGEQVSTWEGNGGIQ